MKHQTAIQLTKERKAALIIEIKHYFETEREESIGDLGCALLLDFIIEKIAPDFYNQGVYDAHAYITESAEDLLSIIK
ncbi:MAG: hypothetical protein BWY45_03528 [Euryarchaeota archaeon ADurb.Bin294]|nr:MAG: hypothetical protein BWY45_03528 [Euryarchaeota archaeon ADurb.Bin294]